MKNGGLKYACAIPPLMLMLAGWELASKQGGTYYPPDTYKPSTFYCPFPFIVRRNGKIQSAFAVWSETYLIFFEWGQSDGKSRGQINCVVFGWGLSVSVQVCTCTHTDTHTIAGPCTWVLSLPEQARWQHTLDKDSHHTPKHLLKLSHTVDACTCSVPASLLWQNGSNDIAEFQHLHTVNFTSAMTPCLWGNCQQWADIILLRTMDSFV